MGATPPGDIEPDPRFTLANERTFLAWIRTSLALVAGGIGAAQLLPAFEVPGGRQALGLPLIVLGGVVAWLSVDRWRDVEGAMRRKEPLPGTALPRVLAITVVLVAAVAVVMAFFGPAE